MINRLKLFARNIRFIVQPLFLMTLLLSAACVNQPDSTYESGEAKAGQSARAVNPAIAGFEPALAVRASACITCHAKLRSTYITDFGHGDPYYFGNPKSAPLGPFGGHIYGDFYGVEPNKTAWLTAEMDREIVVPEAAVDFDLGAAGAQLTADPYPQALQAQSLAEYLQTLESRKQNPSTIIEKKFVFIGAPNAAALTERFGLAPGSDAGLKFVKNDAASPDIAGIEPGASGSYYTNTKEVLCDGDLFIRGTLFLDGPTIATRRGCRIYATGPVFLQNSVTYKSLSAAEDKANLQMVSAEAILFGVGNKSCGAAGIDDPLSWRLMSGYSASTFITRDAAARSIAPQKAGQSIYDQAKPIVSLEDASCHDENISFSRILLNAPQVHIRYKGKFKGLTIAEVALFRPGAADFEFDPVFRDVPVLPMLEDSDYLKIE